MPKDKQPDELGMRDVGKAGMWLLPRLWASHRGITLAIIGLMIINAFLPAVVPVVTGRLVSLFQAGAETTADFLATGGLWLAIISAVVLAEALLSAVIGFFQKRLADEFELVLSKELVQHASTLDLAQFESTDFQDRLQRATRRPGRICLTFLFQVIGLGTAILQAMTLLAVLLWFEPVYTWLLIVPAIPMIWIQWRVARVRHLTEVSQTTNRRWQRYYSGRLTNYQTIAETKLLGLAPLMLQRLEGVSRQIIDSFRRVYRIELWGTTLIATTQIAGFTLVIALTALQIVNDSFAMGNFVTYWLAAWKLRGTLSGMVGVFSRELENGLALLHILEFLEIKPQLRDEGVAAPDLCRGHLELCNVTFFYPGTGQPTIDNVSLSVHPGETVMLVGTNGAGKTTLAKLMARLYDPHSGTISIDGQDIRNIPVESLHRRIAFCPQKPVVFESTVHENIAFGDWERLLDDPETVRRIGARTNIDAMIKDYAEGYQTNLGRMFGEVDLSGGQWQRLAMARALARNAPILILDEPTASLDAHAEQDLYTMIHEQTRDRTMIIISHRFSTVKLADRIVVIHEGQIVEQGTHAALVKMNGQYAALWRRYVTNTLSPKEIAS